MSVVSHQVPACQFTAPFSESAVEAVCAEMHELGLEIDRTRQSSSPTCLAREIATTQLQTTGDCEVAKGERNSWTELLEEIA